MLPYHGRWRNAFKRAPEREARLLMFAEDDSKDKKRNWDVFLTKEEYEQLTPEEKASYDASREETEKAHAKEMKQSAEEEKRKEQEKKVEESDKKPKEKTDAEKAAEAAEEERRRTQLQKEAEFHRRQAQHILNADWDPSMKTPSYEVLTKANNLRTNITSLLELTKSQQEAAKKMREKNAAEGGNPEEGDSHQKEIEANIRILEDLLENLDKIAKPLETLELDRWEQGNMEPGEFLAKYRAYLDTHDAIDRENDALDAAQRQEKKTARDRLFADAAAAVEEARKKRPPAMPAEDVNHLVSEKEVWKYYTEDEKKDIVQSISKGAHLDLFLDAAEREITGVNKEMEKDDLRGKLESKLRKLLNDVMDEEAAQGSGIAKEKDGQSSGAGTVTGSAGTDIFRHPIQSTQSLLRGVNGALGIQWMSLQEIGMMFNELFEARKEAKKQKQMIRVANGAVALGGIAQWIPGFGGERMLTILREQQKAKNNEVKESFKKELGDLDKDLGFKQLFGPHGDGGLLRYYANMGDTNRTRSILEFAAGKGMLYNIEGNSWEKYEVPGGLPFRQLVPAEWSDDAVENYFSNLDFQNNQGKEAQKKAGADYVKGRNYVKEFIEPLKGSLSSAHLWFATGIIEAAMQKVKDGEMSAMITLTVLEEWENNDLFRKYSSVRDEWLDRLPGVNKQMLVGYLKYDRSHLIGGVKTGTHNLSKAWALKEDGSKTERGPRLGPLVVAVRQYLLRKDDSLKNDPEKLKLYTAQVLASKTIKLKNGAVASIYSPELVPYHIKADPNEMRDANVREMGDDNFIERSEIIRGTAEVIQSIGAVTQSGFVEDTKARYFFSHIIDAYDDLVETSAEKGAAGQSAEAEEFRRAAQMYQVDMQEKLDQWALRTLVGSGAKKILTVHHKDQKKDEFLVLGLLQRGLISLELIERLARDERSRNDPATTLLVNLVEHRDTPEDLRKRAEASLQLMSNRAA